MNESEHITEKVIVAGVHTGCLNHLEDTTEESIAELCELVKTAGGEIVDKLIQNKSDIENATYLGEGKLSELKELCETCEADIVVFDDELSPMQLKNITDFLGTKVLDRSMLILDIFAMRAKSGEGKLQVELAQLKYRLPRLRGMGTVLSRTGAGIGTRGPGETKLESDKRHITSRIHSLTEEINELKKHRSLIRERRKKDGVITAALVGYTNVGKSTLLNALTNAEVFAENKLFATLDPTSRAITLPDNRRILLIDTVGFIRKLPHHLIDSFKSTLEEAATADVLLHVIDSSSENADDQIKIVEEVLSSIGAGEIPTMGVLNKTDEESPFIINSPYEVNVRISAKNKTGLIELITELGEIAPYKKSECVILLPYTKGQLLNDIHQNQKVISEEFTNEGVKLSLLLDEISKEKLKEYIV